MAGLTIHRGSTLAPRTREWDPFQQMQELMNLDPLQLMQRWMGQLEAPTTFIPAFEVKETKDAYVFKADLPGVEDKDLDVTVTGDRIVVSGKREVEERKEDERFYTYERSFGSFSRAFTLPEGVDADNVRAELKSGVLSLHVPKRPEVQPRTIKVSTVNEGAKEQKVKA